MLCRKTKDKLSTYSQVYYETAQWACLPIVAADLLAAVDISGSCFPELCSQLCTVTVRCVMILICDL